MAGPGQRRDVLKDGLGHLRVVLTEDAYIGPGRADLLELIVETGSISQAARRMGMSYKRAWQLVQALNDGFGTPLVETSRGGQEQGGAVVSPAGKQVLEAYRRMQAKTTAAIGDDVAALRALIGDISGQNNA